MTRGIHNLYPISFNHKKKLIMENKILRQNPTFHYHEAHWLKWGVTSRRHCYNKYIYTLLLIYRLVLKWRLEVWRTFHNTVIVPSPPVNSQATPVNNLTEVSQRTLQPIPFVFTSRATLVNFRHTALPIQQRIVSTLTSLALLYVELCPHEMWPTHRRAVRHCLRNRFKLT